MSCINTVRMTHINKICHCVSTNIWNTSIIIHVQNNQFLCTEEMSDDVTYSMFMVQFKHASNTFYMFHTCNFIFFLLYVINLYCMAHLKVGRTCALRLCCECMSIAGAYAFSAHDNR